jgi:alpha-ribazole phosphatase
VILLRHTRPRNADGMCYGSSEVPLAADFAVDAARIAATLPPFGRILTSPRARCRLLAEHLAAARNAVLREDARLAEMDFGAWEGEPWTAIDRAGLDAWAADFHGARPHGGESVAMLAARVGALLAETPPSIPPDLWVTHAGVARAACAVLGREDGWQTRLGFGAWLDLSEGDQRQSSPERGSRPQGPTTTF